MSNTNLKQRRLHFISGMIWFIAALLGALIIHSNPAYIPSTILFTASAVIQFWLFIVKGRQSK